MLSLPSEARERLGLTAGQAMEVQTEGGLLVAWKKSDPDPFEKWRGRGLLPVGQSPDTYLHLIRDGDGG
jgi:bifunctional DNA-binding transcriptional regulator/antitoxin component of YhaV-PrlF toxin-antitoxin module